MNGCHVSNLSTVREHWLRHCSPQLRPFPPGLGTNDSLRAGGAKETLDRPRAGANPPRHRSAAKIPLSRLNDGLPQRRQVRWLLSISYVLQSR